MEDPTPLSVPTVHDPPSIPARKEGAARWSRAIRESFPRLERIAAMLIVALCFHSVAISVPDLGVGSGGTVVESNAGRDPLDPEEERAREYALKSAFVLHLFKYTTWPEESLGKKDEPMVVTVIGENHFGKSLEKAFKGQRPHDRDVVVRHLKKVPKEPKGHLVYACGLSEKDERKLIERCQGEPILLIGDYKGFAELGGSMNFHLVEEKVRFQINTGELKKSGLTISSQVLKLAEIVETIGDEE